MPITYATPELRRLMEKPSGLPPPDRRTLFYLVTCPETDEPCHVQDCEYGDCSMPDVQDDQEPPEPSIHISAIPNRDESHPLPPIDYDHQIVNAAVEAALTLDTERLQELEDLHQPWIEGALEKQARSNLIAALTSLVNTVDEAEQPKCSSCSKPNLLEESEECPGCLRLQDHDAPRHEY